MSKINPSGLKSPSTHVINFLSNLSTETKTDFAICQRESAAESSWKIPVHDANGRRICNVEHILRCDYGDSQFRFIPFCNKGMLFNYHRVIAEHANGPLIITENLIDCLRLWQAGTRRVICKFGNTLSRNEESLIMKVENGRGILLLCRRYRFSTLNQILLKRLSLKAFIKRINC